MGLFYEAELLEALHRLKEERQQPQTSEMSAHQRRCDKKK